jgi:hypothetical protein
VTETSSSIDHFIYERRAGRCNNSLILFILISNMCDAVLDSVLQSDREVPLSTQMVLLSSTCRRYEKSTGGVDSYRLHIYNSFVLIIHTIFIFRSDEVISQ